MSRLPYFKFYPSDFILDTRQLTDSEKAIWIDLLCFMWLKSTGKGTLQGHISDLARMLGRERLDLETALDALHRKGICDMNQRESEQIKVTSRRMLRDAKILDNASFRQMSHRSNARCHTKVTPKKSEVRSQKSDKDKDIVLSAPRKSVFWKPTLDEAKVYCLERRNGVDHEKWFAYYESNGWKVGRNAMKDWKAAVRTWERNDFSPVARPARAVDPARVQAKEAELEKIKEKEWAKRMKAGNAIGTPPWPAPFAPPQPKTMPDQPWVPGMPQIES